MMNNVALLAAGCFLLTAGDVPVSFDYQVIDDQVTIGYGVAIGDVDGDRKPDIILADKTAIVWYRNGDWQRFVMADGLTEHDNVCIAARDINGDGMVEVAAGAQWNPGETSDTSQSGAVFYLERPDDPTRTWKARRLHHEPTVHRMRWAMTAPGSYRLIVLPLHGRGNTMDGEGGEPVRVIAYEPPEDEQAGWKYTTIDQSLHRSHNLDIVPDGDRESVYISGKEGIRRLEYINGNWVSGWVINGQSFGEVRIGHDQADTPWLAGVEPMHGNQLTVYNGMREERRNVLTDQLNEGHALAAADLLGTGADQIVVGWRNPDASGKVGIQLWLQQPDGSWNSRLIDDNTVACEDLAVADLDGDGRKDIIASGRATGNLVIYWNRN